MPSLKEIRGRIGSIRNIAQITRAMEMMSASRMKRAQDAIHAARPYSDELRDALSRVAGAVSDVTPIARLVTQDFLEGTYDEIGVAYSTFISTLSQRPEVRTVLPVEQPQMREQQRISNDEYLFEPSPEAVIHQLLPHYVAIDL